MFVSSTDDLISSINRMSGNRSLHNLSSLKHKFVSKFQTGTHILQDVNAISTTLMNTTRTYECW